MQININLIENVLTLVCGCFKRCSFGISYMLLNYDPFVEKTTHY